MNKIMSSCFILCFWLCVLIKCMKTNKLVLRYTPYFHFIYQINATIYEFIHQSHTTQSKGHADTRITIVIYNFTTHIMINPLLLQRNQWLLEASRILI